MKKIKVVGDPNNTPSCSSEIIISNLNKGLKNLELYDEDGELVVYDCLANDHGHKTNFIICPYETAIPFVVLYNAKNRILIGVSNQNQAFFSQGGYPKEKTDVCLLGVDSDLWRPFDRPQNDKFTFGMMCDSNTRAAYDDLLAAFSGIFTGVNDVRLFIKDRWATEKFKQRVKDIAKRDNLDIVLDDTHITDKEQERVLYNNLDCHIFLNRSSTFAMTVAQGMAMQKPTIVMDYSGPRDYCNSLNSCLVNYRLMPIEQQTIDYLQFLGYRNYLLTPNMTSFRTNPQWAIPDIYNIKECLKEIYQNANYRCAIAYYARATAEAMTWTKSAATLYSIVNKH